MRDAPFACQMSCLLVILSPALLRVALISLLESRRWSTELLSLYPTSVLSHTWRGRSIAWKKDSAYGDRLAASFILPLISWAGYFTLLNLIFFFPWNEANINVNIGVDELITKLIANYLEHGSSET